MPVNVYESGIKCGSTDRVGPVTYKDRNSLDLHLMAGSTGIDQGPPSNYASKDIDGQTRPIGAAADAVS